MLSRDQQGFQVGPWRIEPLLGAITGPQGKQQHVEPKVMEVLVLLAGHAKELVTREQLLDAVWSDQVGADQLLTRAVSELRRALGDERGNPEYIETVPKRGYRMLRDVHPIDSLALQGERPASKLQPAPGIRILAAIAATLLMIAVVYFAYDPFGVSDGSDLTLLSTTDAPQIYRLDSNAKKSVAVLPFVNMSDDPNNEFLADGLAEEIRNLIAEIPELRVTSRASSFAFRDRAYDPQVIGEKLDVQWLVDGSVRRSGEQVRIAASIIEVSSGMQIWTTTLDRNMADIFELQDATAIAVIDALKLRTGTYPNRGRPTRDADAYALYLRARIALNILDARTAEANLRDAVELDPSYAEAHELLAYVYWTNAVPDIDAARRRMLMRDSAATALAIDADRDLARVLFAEGSRDEYSLATIMNAQVKVALKHSNDPVVLRILSWNLLLAGYLNEALRVAERFVAIDPLSSIAHVRHTAALAAVGRRADSETALRIADILTPVDMSWYFGELRLASGQDAAAIDYFDAHARGSGLTDTAWIGQLVASARDYRTGLAALEQRIPEIIASLPVHDISEWEYRLNQWYLLFGFLDRYYEIILALDPGEDAWSEAMYYLWGGTIYRDLGFTGHPRYVEIAERMGFVGVWEQRGPPDFCEKSTGKWVCY